MKGGDQKSEKRRRGPLFRLRRLTGIGAAVEEGFKGGDRISIDLPRPEEDLLEAVAATGKPVVLVLANGSALAVNWAKQHVNAIIESWYPREKVGRR